MSIRNQRGQGLIEYVILVALVAVATMGLVKSLQGSVQVNLSRIIYALQGREAGVRGDHQPLKQSDISKKDFSDFWRGSHRGGGAGGSTRDED